MAAVVPARQAATTDAAASAVYNRKLAAAAVLTGPRRYTTYQALETDLLRNAAPSAPLLNWQESEFFSARVGCQVFQPIYQIDLAALCLKRRR